MAGSFCNIQELKLLKKQVRLTSEWNVMIVKTSVYLLKSRFNQETGDLFLILAVFSGIEQLTYFFWAFILSSVK